MKKPTLELSVLVCALSVCSSASRASEPSPQAVECRNDVRRLSGDRPDDFPLPPPVVLRPGDTGPVTFLPDFALVTANLLRSALNRPGTDARALVKDYLAIRDQLPVEARIDFDGHFLLHGVDIAPRDRSIALSDRLRNDEDIGLDAAFRYGPYLTLGNRILGAKASLREMARELLRGDLSMETLRDDERVWPTHAEDHAYNIAAFAVEAVEAAYRTGMLARRPGTPGKEIPRDAAELAAEVQQLKVLGALLGLSHDMGMFRSGGGIRENHWKIVGNFAFGGNYKGKDVPLSRQRQLLDKFVRDFARDENNPLRQAFAELVRHPDFAGKYKGATEAEKVEVLMREFLIANFSHGVKEIKGLGIGELATRRDLYLKELGELPTADFTPTDLAAFYAGHPKANFMAWAVGDYPPGHPAHRLRRLFSGGEQILNYADANRSRGPGRLFGPDGIQIVRHTKPDGKITAYAVLTGPKGEKMLVDVGERIFAGVNVFPMRTVEERPGQGPQPIRYQFRVVSSDFAPESVRTAADQTGRLIGRDAVFFHRGLGDMVTPEKYPRVEVMLPDEPGTNKAFEDALAESISFNMAVWLHANNWLRVPASPEVMKVLAKKRLPPKNEWPPDLAKFLESVQQRYWYYSANDNPVLTRIMPPAEAPRKKEYDRPGVMVDGKPARLAERSDADREAVVTKLKAAGAFAEPHTVIDPATKQPTQYRPELLVEGAFFAKVKKGETLVERGDPRGMIYLIVSGTVSGEGYPGTGRRPFVTSASDSVWPIIGGTAFLTKTDPGRNSTVKAETDLTVLCIPKETGEKYWNPRYLAIPPDKVREHLERLTADK